MYARIALKTPKPTRLNRVLGKETILKDFSNTLQFILPGLPYRLYQHVGIGFFNLYI